MAVFANTINGYDIYAKRAEQDKDGNQIDTTYAKKSEISEVPTTTGHNTGDVLTITSDGADWQALSVKTQKSTVDGTMSSGVLSFSVNEGSFSVLNVGANTSATNIAINFVSDSNRSANDLFEASFEIDLSTIIDRQSLAFTFSKDNVAINSNMIGNKPSDITVVKNLIGVIANDLLFLGETKESN